MYRAFITPRQSDPCEILCGICVSQDDDLVSLIHKLKGFPFEYLTILFCPSDSSYPTNFDTFVKEV